jgi:hypothetical protein
MQNWAHVDAALALTEWRPTEQHGTDTPRMQVASIAFVLFCFAP